MSDTAEQKAEMCEGFQMPSPGPEHELLKPFEGTFQAEVKMWMGPGEPAVSTGTMVNSWKLGGMYLHQDYVGDATDGPFPSFAGQGFWGFNSNSKMYEGFWIDNASSMMQNESGSVDQSGKVWTMTSKMPCAQTGQLMTKKSVITLLDNDNNKLEMYFTGDDGNESKAMEINYRRK